MQNIPFGIRIEVNEGNAAKIRVPVGSSTIDFVYCFLCLDPSGDRYFFRFDEDAKKVAKEIPGWEYIG